MRLSYSLCLNTTALGNYLFHDQTFVQPSCKNILSGHENMVPVICLPTFFVFLTMIYDIGWEGLWGQKNCN